MKALIVGATGYIGSAVARRFKMAGAEVAGIMRSARNAEVLRVEGILPVAGDLGHPATIADAARNFDITVLAGIGSGTDERAVVSAVIESCRASARRFIYTSGTGVLGIESRDGQWSDYAFAEDDPFPFPGGATRAWRLPTEDMVRTAGLEGVAGMIIRPPLIYGRGGSTQVPAIFKSALTTGSACYVGEGLNLYSNVHVDDLADLYWLVAANGAAGALYHAVSGEADFRSIAEAVASVLKCPTRSVTFEEACSIWGEQIAGVALAVNSRSIARRSQQELGWKPRHRDILQDIYAGSYCEKYARKIEP